MQSFQIQVMAGKLDEMLPKAKYDTLMNCEAVNDVHNFLHRYDTIILPYTTSS